MKRFTLIAALLMILSFLTGSCEKGEDGDDGDRGDDTMDTGGPLNGDVLFEINTSESVRPISRFIYGTNQMGPSYEHLTLGRSGGNRWTAYNWENNASNAGSDWNYSSDDYLLNGDDTPGEAVRQAVETSLSVGAGHVITVPMAGYVSADKSGPVDLDDPNHIEERFHESVPAKAEPFSLTPDTTDNVVYQDEFVNWLINEFEGAVSDEDAPIMFSLDNEPALWSHTHEEIHPEPVTYEELMDKTVDLASAIKAVDGDALILGYVGYGWSSFVSLQDAPDSSEHGDFIEYFLDEMQRAEDELGARLVDVLDIHWYPEAQGGGVRITEDDFSDEVAAARIQAPRSLWDDTYTEDSWITEWSTMGPIALIPRMMEKIDSNYPGTRLAITEYNYGGGEHISGAIAEADALGVFGREGVYAAALWPLSQNHRFCDAAFDMYRDFDGEGGAFGDTSVLAETSDAESTSVYASVDDGDPRRMVVVAINKAEEPLMVDILIEHSELFDTVEVFQLTADEPAPVPAGSVEIMGNRLTCEMPAMSVSTLALERN